MGLDNNCQLDLTLSIRIVFDNILKEVEFDS